MKRKLLVVVGCLLVLGIIAIVIIGFSLGKVVKVGVETVGPKITQTTLTLEAADLSLLTGSANLKGLVVGSPQGYTAPNAISIGLVAVRVAPSSVLSDKIVVQSVRVEAPVITLEGNPLGANNLKKILDNVNVSTGNSGSPAGTPTSGVASKPGQKLEVDDLLITGIKVHIGTTSTIPVPDIHLSDLGTGPEGITPADLTQRVLTALINGTLQAVVGNAGNLGKGAENFGKEGVGGVKKSLGNLFH